jgi:DNA modification methylase
MKEIERTSVPIKDLKPSPYNPRRIEPAALAALERSIDEFGLVQEIVVNRRNMHVVGGHQRLLVLKRRKHKTVPIAYVDLDDIAEKALNVALNSEKLAGSFVDDKLDDLIAEILREREDLSASLRLDELMQDHAAAIASIFNRDADDVPAIPKEAHAKIGDLWFLGSHRLIVGDVTEPHVLETLLWDEESSADPPALELVDSLVTDPPYGVDYGEKTRYLGKLQGSATHRDIANDALPTAEYRAWFASWMKTIPFADPATFFICMSGQEFHNLRLAIDDCGWKWGDYLLWVKHRAVLSRKDYNQRYELVAFGEAKGSLPPPDEQASAPALDSDTLIAYGWPERHRFYGGHKRTNVLEYDTPSKNKEHPTMKPVALIEQLIVDGSPKGGLILDCFGGSGTTLIAAQRTFRRARLSEIDPIYADVILERFADLTGIDPVRADGAAWSQVKAGKPDAEHTETTSEAKPEEKPKRKTKASRPAPKRTNAAKP